MSLATVNIPLSNIRIRLVAGITDMRKGFTGLSAIVQNALEMHPLGGHLFLFRGRRCDRLKLHWWDGTGLSAFPVKVRCTKPQEFLICRQR